jgi:hypothetical protein
MRYIQTNLSTSGALKQNRSDGYVYLDIDDDYIHKLIQFIANSGYEEPPYFKRAGAIGAHVSVIYPSEIKKYNIGRISEAGQDYPFKVVGCLVTHTPDSQEYDSSYVLLIKAPALDAIRAKYGIPATELGLHITIGIKSMASAKIK